MFPPTAITNTFSDVEERRNVRITSSKADRISKQASSTAVAFKSSQIAREKKEKEKEELPNVGFLRILKMNQSEWWIMLGEFNVRSIGEERSVALCARSAGCCFSVVAGSIDPLNAIVFAEVLNIFTLSDSAEQERRAIIFGLLFLILGAAGFIAYICEVGYYSASYFISCSSCKIFSWCFIASDACHISIL